LRKGFDGESAFGREERVRCDDRARIVFGRRRLSGAADPRHRHHSDGNADSRPDVNTDCVSNWHSNCEAVGNADCDPDREAIGRADRYAHGNARANCNAHERPDDQCMREAVACGTLDFLRGIEQPTDDYGLRG
jgi:hypothetical protein